jgi:hypothetical protein
LSGEFHGQLALHLSNLRSHQQRLDRWTVVELAPHHSFDL